MRLHSRPLPAVLIIPQRVTSWPVLLLSVLIMFHVAFHGICHAQERKLLPGLLLISLKVSEPLWVCWLITISGHHPLGQAGVLSVPMTVLCWSHVTSKVFLQLTGLVTVWIVFLKSGLCVLVSITVERQKKKSLKFGYAMLAVPFTQWLTAVSQNVLIKWFRPQRRGLCIRY